MTTIYRQFEFNPDPDNDPNPMVGEFVYVPNDLVVKMGPNQAFTEHTGFAPTQIIHYDASNFYDDAGDQVHPVDEMNVTPDNYVEATARRFVEDMIAVEATVFHYRGDGYQGPAVLYHRKDWADQVAAQTKVPTTVETIDDPAGTPLVFKDGEKEVLRRDRGEAAPTIYLLRLTKGATLKPA